jgi:cell division protein FtsL
VNILRSQALNMVFLRVLFFAHFCLFHLLMMFLVSDFIYADDLQIYHSSYVADLQRCYEEVETDLKRIYDWAGSNGLKLNPKKRQVILTQRGEGW